MTRDRKVRVGEAMRDALSEMIRRDVKDARVTAAGLVSITSVELNVDLSVANVYVSVYGEDKVAERALEGLRAAAGFLRGPLARKLQLGRPPELRFHRDTGVAYGMALQQIVRDDEAAAKAAGRGEKPEPDPEVAPAPDPDSSADAVSDPAGPRDD